MSAVGAKKEGGRPEKKGRPGQRGGNEIRDYQLHWVGIKEGSFPKDSCWEGMLKNI